VTSPSGLGEIPEESEDDGNDSDRTVTDEPTGSVHDSTVQIVCGTNEVFHADHVICTVPLGVLKSNPNLFEPPLPEYKRESIDSLLFGTVDKIFLEFDRPFLSQDISEIMMLWEDEVPLSATVEKTPEQIASSWFKKIYSFSKINDTLLLGWISGKEAEYMETLDDKVVSDKCTELLKKFLKDPCIPSPRRCVRTHWKNQPYSCGSYTSIAVGASQEDIENIAQPLYSNPHQSKVSFHRFLFRETTLKLPPFSLRFSLLENTARRSITAQFMEPTLRVVLLPKSCTLPTHPRKSSSKMTTAISVLGFKESRWSNQYF
jgi:spermine oxidase